MFIFAVAPRLAIAMLFDGLVLRLDLGDEDGGHEVNVLGDCLLMTETVRNRLVLSFRDSPTCRQFGVLPA